MDTSDQAKLLPSMMWVGAGVLFLAISAVIWFGRRERVGEAEPASLSRHIPRLAGAGIALLLAFAALTLAISSPALEATDVAVAAAVRGWGGTLVTRVMVGVSDVDAVTGSIRSLALLLAALWLAGSRRRLGPFAAMFFGHWGLELFFKYLIHRPRPPMAGQVLTYSYPSGHVLTATVLTGALLALYLPACRHPWQRALAWAFAVAWCVLVAFSRLELGRHYLTDVTGALLLGAAWICLCQAALLALRRPSAPGGQPRLSREE